MNSSVYIFVILQCLTISVHSYNCSNTYQRKLRVRNNANKRKYTSRIIEFILFIGTFKVNI